MWIQEHPTDARWWGEHFSRLAERPPEHGGGPDALGRAVAIWRAYDYDQSLQPDQICDDGHLIRRCALALGDRDLLLKALAFHEHALARSPNNFQSGYVAEVCTDLANLPGTSADAVRMWYDRAVAACCRYAMPDDFHFSVHYAELLLERATHCGLPADHPDLEEAWSYANRQIPSHGDHYLVQSEIAAHARLLQGCDDEAVTILRTGLARIGPSVTVDEIAMRKWFQALAPERAARIRQQLKAPG